MEVPEAGLETRLFHSSRSEWGDRRGKPIRLALETRYGSVSIQAERKERQKLGSEWKLKRLPVYIPLGEIPVSEIIGRAFAVDINPPYLRYLLKIKAMKSANARHAPARRSGGASDTSNNQGPTVSTGENAFSANLRAN